MHSCTIIEPGTLCANCLSVFCSRTHYNTGLIYIATYTTTYAAALMELSLPDNAIALVFKLWCVQ